LSPPQRRFRDDVGRYHVFVERLWRSVKYKVKSLEFAGGFVPPWGRKAGLFLGHWAAYTPISISTMFNHGLHPKATKHTSQHRTARCSQTSAGAN
jgi:hypothetical protein